jgi:glyoxylase-like metal-dependent hydrolase (beta-lactamase superfamily II)
VRSIVEVADGVFVATSRRDVTTSTMIVRDAQTVLVDPAWDPDELAGLADVIEARGWTVTAGLATHAHHDHVLWHPRFGNVPRYASARTVELAALVGSVLALSGSVPAIEPIELIEHDGHCPGHCAVWLPDRAVLLAGDMLSDVELPLPLDPDDLSAYLAGLDVLTPYVRRARVLVPGHGYPTDDPVARLDADRRYLDDLRRTGRSDDPRIANAGMANVHERIQALARNDG